MSMRVITAGLLCFCGVVFAQHARLYPAPESDMPAQVDSNSPAFWQGGQMFLFNSTGDGPIRSSGAGQFQLSNLTPAHINLIHPWPAWIEAAWIDSAGGPLFAWYHQEHWGLCAGSRLAVPQVGYAVSYDGGETFLDYGGILESGDPYDCSSQNGYIAGGYGDFSVVLDRQRKFFYFLFTNYAGPVETQGICIARMAFDSRFSPWGAVFKYYNGGWTEPGVGGRVTPIFPARVSWQQANTDSFWGPALHWNTYLQSYVMLLNRSCCSPGFPQKGIYASYSATIDDPASWTRPEKLLNDPGWYPQVLGLEPGTTDRLAGRRARLYIYGNSHLEIEFVKPSAADNSSANATESRPPK